MKDEIDINHIDRVLDGDIQAFEELYENTIQDVYKTIHFLVDEKNDVDDIVQETYIQVYNNLTKFDRTKTFKPWVTGIAIKQLHTYRRKKWMMLKVIHKAVQHQARYEFDTASEIIEKINNEKLLELINQLPYKLKQIVILHYLNELSQEEVAQVLCIPLGTVKSRIGASLKKLRQKGYDHKILFKGGMFNEL
ncbi:sigma-70 family RNA polymerase sigma factor [Bacillus salitolerans]|uniref:Sigma-70 family RNA polymerase sigma factor n=1 Tax=Bacillus salitolerans TaxID=1437434 RepID=A0ABW4LMG7_9BACI